MKQVNFLQKCRRIYITKPLIETIGCNSWVKLNSNIFFWWTVFQAMCGVKFYNTRFYFIFNLLGIATWIGKLKSIQLIEHWVATQTIGGFIWQIEFELCNKNSGWFNLMSVANGMFGSFVPFDIWNHETILKCVEQTSTWTNWSYRNKLQVV